MERREMVGITSFGAYIPLHRLARAEFAKAWGGRALPGEKAVANFDEDSLTIAVEAAIESRVTITGAFDDASASYYGGLVVTDNKQRRILKRKKIPEDHRALFHVPSQKSYTANADMKAFRKLAQISKSAHRLALNGYHWEALTLNGLAHALVLGWEPTIAIDALQAGAIAAGLSGKGPATVAITKTESVSKIRSAMSKFEGQIIEAKLNNMKARILDEHT